MTDPQTYEGKYYQNMDGAPYVLKVINDVVLCIEYSSSQSLPIEL
jgi:hypothetical protein